MRYIYFPATVVDERWQRRAEMAAAKAAEKADEPERQEFISSRSKIWSDLKPKLERLSGGKCWYTEAKDKVSHWQVDHYRPKSLYPWLAFAWHNLRLCGGIPNVKKLNNFPLEYEGRRATADRPDTRTEVPLLLDPTRWGDPDLLTFNSNGEPACAKPRSSSVARRVRETVILLELDSEALCAHRREKWRSCERKLKNLRAIIEERRQQETADAAHHIDELCRDLEALYDDNAEFSATAWACARELNAEKLVQLARQHARQLQQSAFQVMDT